MANDTFSYKGKEYTMYEATQYMRRLEREMRNLKRELIGFDSAAKEEEFKKAAVKLQKKSKEYNTFSKVSSLKKRNASTQVIHFDRRLAAKARRKYK